jgi:demethylmenaquinone methyltransferase/2-methoxy-6-polyprenyl-1,4-benzoquinol methylase
MNEFQMPSQEKKADFVRENFNIISEKYDLFNDLNSFFLHRLWKNQIAKTIEKYSPGNDLVCLDLCCGTGDISLRLNNLPNTKKVHAVDFSEKFSK